MLTTRNSFMDSSITGLLAITQKLILPNSASDERDSQNFAKFELVATTCARARHQPVGKYPSPGALNERLRFLLRRLGLIRARWLLFGLQLLLLLCVFLLHLLGLLLVLLFYLLLPRFIRVPLR